MVEDTPINLSTSKRQIEVLYRIKIIVTLE